MFCFKRNLAAPRYSSNKFGSTLGLHKLSTLRFVKWHFLSFVFKFFVPNLFLSLNSSNKPYCISVCYIKSVVYQEEHDDWCLCFLRLITWTDCAIQGRLRHVGAICFMFQPLECKFRQMECKFQPMERRIHRHEIFFTSGRNNCSIGAQQLQHRGAAIAAKGRSNCGTGVQQFPAAYIIPNYYRHRARRQADKSTGGLHRQFYKKYKLCVISLQTFI